MIKHFDPMAKVHGSIPPHGSRDLKAGPNSQVFMSVKQVGLAAVKLMENCSFWSEFRMQMMYIIYAEDAKQSFRGSPTIQEHTRFRLRLPHLKCSLHSARSVGEMDRFVGWWGLDLPPPPRKSGKYDFYRVSLLQMEYSNPCGGGEYILRMVNQRNVSMNVYA